MTDHSNMKLGKKAARLDTHRPKMAKFLSGPQEFPLSWESPAAQKISSWGMMRNDELGCCTIAGVGHKEQADTAVVRKEFTASDDQIVEYYSKWDGYIPGNPNTDQGGVEADVLAAWTRDGFVGRKLVAYGSVEPKNHDDMRQLCYETNGLYIGVLLPTSAQTESVWGDGTGAGDTTPGSWGGHCVYVYGYTSDSHGGLASIKFISWGKKMEMTAAFWDQYVDECWAVFTAALVDHGKVPAGIAVQALAQAVHNYHAVGGKHAH